VCLRGRCRRPRTEPVTYHTRPPLPGSLLQRTLAGRRARPCRTVTYHPSGQRRRAVRAAKRPDRARAQTVNAVLEDGRTVGVQAQQYAVLVMDVPDLRAEAEKRALEPRSCCVCSSDAGPAC